LAPSRRGPGYHYFPLSTIHREMQTGQPRSKYLMPENGVENVSRGIGLCFFVIALLVSFFLMVM
jgi:hypothetical protein